MALHVIQPGFLSLIQDLGRFGQHHLGLTTGGPMDPTAFRWANRLLGNAENCACLEITMGGLKLKATDDHVVAITGAMVSVSIDGQPQPQWQTIIVKSGETLELGYATQGCRIYLAVAGGFNVTAEFGSASTVMRENVGGLNGGKLSAQDKLEVESAQPLQQGFRLAPQNRPEYREKVSLRVIPGYQDSLFPRQQQRRFFYHDFVISDLADRMGYRLKGPKIECSVSGLLSEGICLGAIQIPADGQPIVLMNDRQTIGGYPKIGSVLSLDLAKMAQLTAGASVTFEPISMDHAHNLLHLAEHKFHNTQLEPCALESSHD